MTPPPRSLSERLAECLRLRDEYSARTEGLVSVRKFGEAAHALLPELAAELERLHTSINQALVLLESGRAAGDTLRAAIEKAEPQPSTRFQSTSTLSPCPRCGETVPTTFKAGVLTYQCLKCAEDGT